MSHTKSDRLKPRRSRTAGSPSSDLQNFHALQPLLLAQQALWLLLTRASRNATRVKIVVQAVLRSAVALGDRESRVLACHRNLTVVVAYASIGVHEVRRRVEAASAALGSSYRPRATM